MTSTQTLRTAYRINALATLVSGLALLAAGKLLAPRFDVPAAALWAMGGFFVAFATWIWSISRRERLLWSEAVAAGLLDGGYALGSLVVLAALGSRMTPELELAVGALAVPVAVFAALELTGALRLRAGPAVA
jgi:hypothetical protein